MTSQKDKATSSNRSCMDNRQSIFFNIFINLCLMRDFIALTHINNNNNSNNNKVLCVCGVLLKRGTGREERVTRDKEQGNRSLKFYLAQRFAITSIYNLHVYQRLYRLACIRLDILVLRQIILLSPRFLRFMQETHVV